MPELWPRRGLWRDGPFLELWSAQTISELGTQVTALALPLAALFTLHSSALEVSSCGRSRSVRSSSSDCRPASGSTASVAGR